MNLLVFILCILTISDNKWLLAETVDDCELPTIDNEVLQIDVAFQKAGIVPDLIPTSPKRKFKIVFDSVEANFGNLISPVRMSKAPLFLMDDATPNIYYTVMVLDPDYPSPSNTVLRHGVLALCVNILPNEDDELLSHFVLLPWISPTPPVGTGRHRHIALVYAQNGPIDTNNIALLKLAIPRVRFDLDAFVRNYTLGEPLFGNFWYTSIDECCNLSDHCEQCRVKSKYH